MESVILGLCSEGEGEVGGCYGRSGISAGYGVCGRRVGVVTQEAVGYEGGVEVGWLARIVRGMGSSERSSTVSSCSYAVRTV